MVTVLYQMGVVLAINVSMKLSAFTVDSASFEEKQFLRTSFIKCSLPKSLQRDSFWGQWPRIRSAFSIPNR